MANDVAVLLSPASSRSHAWARRWSITAGYFGSFFSIGLCLASLGPILPVLAEKTGSTIDQLALLFGMRSMGYMVGSLLGGVIFDRVRRTHLPLLVGNVLCACGCALLPSLTTVSSLGAALTTQGLCMGLLDTGGNVLLIWLQGSERVEPYMQCMHFCFALGAVLSPLLIEATIRASNARDGDGPDEIAAAFYFMCGSLACSSIPLIGPGPRPPPKPEQLSADADTAARPASSARCNRIWCTGKTLLVASSGLCLMVYVGLEVGFGGFIFTFSSTELHLSGTYARTLNSLFWGGLALGRLGAVPLATRFKPHTLLYVDFLGCLVAALLMLTWHATSPATRGNASLPLNASYGNLDLGRCNGTYVATAADASAIDGAVPINCSLPTAVPRGGGGGDALVWLTTGLFGLSMASVFPTERSMHVSGFVASIFVLCASCGEALLPLAIALSYTAAHSSFLAIVLGASALQFAAFGGMRSAARALRATTNREASGSGGDASGDRAASTIAACGSSSSSANAFA
jgi:FHS family Na+ dependent glucose MFS transporter 1